MEVTHTGPSTVATGGTVPTSAPIMRLRSALGLLREQRVRPMTDPRGRDLSIAITHVEDALLRLEHGGTLGG